MTRINLTLSDDDGNWELKMSGAGSILDFLADLAEEHQSEPVQECYCEECDCEYEICDCVCSGECEAPSEEASVEVVVSDDEALVQELVKLQALKALPPVDIAARSFNNDENGLPQGVVAYGNVLLAKFKGERDIQTTCIGWCNMQGVATLYGLIGSWSVKAATYKFQMDEGRFLYALSYERTSLEDDDFIQVVLDEETASNWLIDDDSDEYDDFEPETAECSLNTPENTPYDPSEADYEDEEDGF